MDHAPPLGAASASCAERPGSRMAPAELAGALAKMVRQVADFPRAGILFQDITPLLADAASLRAAVQGLAELAAPLSVDYVLAAEARGFLLGPALAAELGAGFLLARKPGKLPHRTIAAEYELEYGTDRLEAHADPLPAGARVLVHDDLLATGGTALAMCRLAERLGGEVAGCGFLIELPALPGRQRLSGRPVHSLIAVAD